MQVHMCGVERKKIKKQTKQTHKNTRYKLQDLVFARGRHSRVGRTCVQKQVQSVLADDDDDDVVVLNILNCITKFQLKF